MASIASLDQFQAQSIWEMSVYMIKCNKMQTVKTICLVCLLTVTISSDVFSAELLKVKAFRVDASPPIGSPVAYAPARKIVDPLSARGIVLIAGETTVVLCAVDWIGIGNGGQDVWRERLAEAAGTTAKYVSVHVLHQHDGCRCDFTAEEIMEKAGLGGKKFDNVFLRSTIQKVAEAVKKAKADAVEVTHLGFGEAKVEKVASNRRILGENGKVKIGRMSSSRNPAAIAAPEGTIDPFLKCVSFWNREQPVAVLTYYATHPQSYYGKGDVTSEFVGIARTAREKSLNDLPHIHFNGAGGNVAAGKYNDGTPARRPILAKRMEQGMLKAWKNTQKTAISESDFSWRTKNIQLPLHQRLSKEKERTKLNNKKLALKKRFSAATKLAWIYRCEAEYGVDISALKLGEVWLLNLPGELFVEYQLAAQQIKPGEHVCTAAYGDYGPGYIGTKIAYSQGGYEVGASKSSPEVEQVLMDAIKEVLK
jgi:hypothetical protein